MSNGQGTKVAEAYASFRLEIDPSADVKAAEANMRQAMDKLDKMLEAERNRIRDDTTKAGKAETKAKLAEIEKQKREVERAKKSILNEQKFDMGEHDKSARAKEKAARDAQRATDKQAKAEQKANKDMEKEIQKAQKEAKKESERKEKAAAKEAAAKSKSQSKIDSKGASVLGNDAMSSMGGMMKTLGTMSGGAFVAAVGVGLVALAALIAKKSIELAIPKETANWRRDRMNKQGGNGTGWDNGQLDQMAKAIAEIGVQSEISVVKAQTLLLAFTNIKGDQFKKILGLSGDVASVMGIDIVQAAEKLGSALEDPIKASEGGLEDLGIKFSILEQNQVRAAVAARDYAGAQDLIISKLGRFKGASEEFAQTTEGKWESVKVKLEQLGETIGAALLPALNSVLDFLLRMAKEAKFAWDNFGELADIAGQAIWVAFLELGDHCKDIFLLILGHWWGVMKGMRAAAEWGWDAVKGVFNGEDAGAFGEKVSKAYMEGMEFFLTKTGKTPVVADAEKKLSEMWDKYRKKKKLTEEKTKEMPDKPNGAASPHINSKPTSWFENSGFADLGKKIQSQIMPSAFESKMDQQVQLAGAQVAKQDVANGLLGVIAMNIASVAKMVPGEAVFAR
jgi:hypothetical protein